MVFLRHDRAGVEQHAHRLDRVEGDPLGALDDAGDRRLRESGHQPIQELRHFGRGQRLEVDARHAAYGRRPSPGGAPAAPAGPAPPRRSVRCGPRPAGPPRSRAVPGRPSAGRRRRALSAPARAIRSKKVRHAANSSSRPSAGQLCEAQQAGQPRLHQAPLARGRRRTARAWRRASAGRSRHPRPRRSAPGSRTISASAQ